MSPQLRGEDDQPDSEKIKDDDIVWRFIHHCHIKREAGRCRVGTGTFRNSEASLFLPTLGANRDRILQVLVGFGLAEIKARHIREFGYKIVETPPDDRLAGEPHAVIIPKPSRIERGAYGVSLRAHRRSNVSCLLTDLKAAIETRLMQAVAKGGCFGCCGA